MAQCRFLSLPQEIRDHIFEYALEAEDRYDADAVRARTDSRIKRLAINNHRWHLEVSHTPSAPLSAYLTLSQSNRQLNREIARFLNLRPPTPAKLILALEYPNLYPTFTRLPSPPNSLKVLEIEMRVNHIYHPAYLTRGSQNCILSALSETLKRFVFRGPHLARPSVLSKPLHLETVRITMLPHVPFEEMGEIYGFPQRQLESLYVEFKGLLRRFARSGLPWGMIDGFEVRFGREDRFEIVPVTSNIWDENDFVFFQYGGFNWDRGVEGTDTNSFEPDLVPW